MVNGSFLKLSWSPVYLEGWNISHYYISYQSSSIESSADLLSKKFVVDGELTLWLLGPEMLFLHPHSDHALELRAVITIDGLEGLGEVTGQVAVANMTIVEGNWR